MQPSVYDVDVTDVNNLAFISTYMLSTDKTYL